MFPGVIGVVEAVPLSQALSPRTPRCWTRLVCKHALASYLVLNDNPRCRLRNSTLLFRTPCRVPWRTTL